MPDTLKITVSSHNLNNETSATTSKSNSSKETLLVSPAKKMAGAATFSEVFHVGIEITQLQTPLSKSILNSQDTDDPVNLEEDGPKEHIDIEDLHHIAPETQTLTAAKPTHSFGPENVWDEENRIYYPTENQLIIGGKAIDAALPLIGELLTGGTLIPSTQKSVDISEAIVSDLVARNQPITSISSSAPTLQDDQTAKSLIPATEQLQKQVPQIQPPLSPPETTNSEKALFAPNATLDLASPKDKAAEIVPESQPKQATGMAPTQLASITVEFAGEITVEARNVQQQMEPDRVELNFAPEGEYSSSQTLGFTGKRETMTSPPLDAELTTPNSTIEASKPSLFSPDWNGVSDIAIGASRFSQTGFFTSAIAQPSSIFQGAEISRQIATQLANIAIQATDQSVNLTLNPKELGHIRMSMTALENGISVTITAERSETLDIMRRNISVLEQEFREIGYSDINFSFSQQNEDQQDPNSKQSKHQTYASIGSSDEPDTETSKNLTILSTDGLDIRI